ncbi:MAG TPA: hypothetical protein VEZ14_08260 [Dehalococcoidia bacterium]|nr:hypothetical protein [Dehalococcoidia bacterium]
MIAKKQAVRETGEGSTDTKNEDWNTQRITVTGADMGVEVTNGCGAIWGCGKDAWQIGMYDALLTYNASTGTTSTYATYGPGTPPGGCLFSKKFVGAFANGCDNTTYGPIIGASADFAQVVGGPPSDTSPLYGYSHDYIHRLPF